ncbi:MAG: hypothetical protein CFE23_05710 [Flavobacterium sp. BFFFF1]|uniref:hypothetical protein n=1 Tax=Flavobacterium sp. BFFFF1 TaxID=2015557 RepID=UPI000BC8EBBB|nr:hypothetical protein [Flavobacterium sp. BFFFF1]OYU81259.1 MAG: hypothetical protein CFE23_05710 [Flavobacterium sp. BFFFF1]
MNAQKKITQNMYVVGDTSTSDVSKNLTVVKNKASEKEEAKTALQLMTISLSVALNSYASQYKLYGLGRKFHYNYENVAVLNDNELLEVASQVLEAVAEYESDLWKYDVNRKTILSFLNTMSVFQFLISLP